MIKKKPFESAGYLVMLATLLFLICFVTNFPKDVFADIRGITVKARTRTGAISDIRLYSGYHALVVGCADYRSGWPKLPNPVQDAREVAAMLKGFGWYVEKLENPDGRTFRQTLNKLVADPGRKKDIAILFWYSGHGHTLTEADETKLGYLVPVDAPDPDKDLSGFMNSAISMRMIETVSKQIQSKHVLMVFDSCFSGAIFQMVRAKPSPYIQEKVAWPVRQFITAGTEDEQVPDRSVFKTVFIQGVRDGFADLNGDTYITGEELGVYLQEKVVNYTRKAQHPQFGKINNPKLDKGDFILLASSSGAVIQTPSATPDTKGRLSVTANVSGVNVYLDGDYVGKTPLSEIAVSAGTHRMHVEKKGYESYRKSVDILSGRSVSLEAYLTALQPKTGWLYVDTTPSDATVKILNISPRFYQGMELKPGSYNVEVSAGGYETQCRWVTLSAGEDKRMDFRLSILAVTRPVSSGSSRTSNSLGMEFVYIKPGTFMMGSPPSEPGRDDDERQHRVTLTKGYYMQTTEVTQGQWKAVMGSNPSHFKNSGDDCPVEMVSWNDVQEFIRKLNQIEGTDKYRLPTEAEWEYACRAGTETPYSFGLCLSTDQANYDGNYPLPGCSRGGYHHNPVSVANFPANAWGLYGMHGNVWEWCQDWKEDYPSGSVTDPEGPSSGYRWVLRGGSWSNAARDCRSATRLISPAVCSKCFGFRLAMTNTPTYEAHAKIVARDGHYVKYENGIAFDTKNNLEWYAGPDIPTTWGKAKSWAENLNMCGKGWRLPSFAELGKLYQKGSGTRNMTFLLETTGWDFWSNRTRGPSAMLLVLFKGDDDGPGALWYDDEFSVNCRGFAVRHRSKTFGIAPVRNYPELS